MTLDAMKAARRYNGTALGMQKLASTCSPENTKPLHEFQAAFVSARYGLTPCRAKLAAELMWSR